MTFSAQSSGNASAPLSEKVGTAVFYGAASLAVIFVNKIVLSQYGFKNFEFLALAQFISTLFAVGTLHILTSYKMLPVGASGIQLPRLSVDMIREILPVSLLFLGNVVFGLGGTGSLSLPMFTALRRFSIPMTMLGEWLAVPNGKRPSRAVVLCVTMMVVGALIAALSDLSFDFRGYTLVFLNNLCTALSGVYLRRASNSARAGGKMSVLFYNSLFSAILLIGYFSADIALFHIASQSAASTPLLRGGGEQPIATIGSSSSAIGQVITFAGWADAGFLWAFFFASVMGSVLNYSIFLCTNANSALTTSVVGCLKNVLTTYVGMITMGDYTFSWANFMGLNISIVGSVIYAVVAIGKE